MKRITITMLVFLFAAAPAEAQQQFRCGNETVTLTCGVSSPAPAPVPPAPPTPQPTPVPPPSACPATSNNIMPWEPFLTTNFFPVPAVVTSGDLGLAVQVMANGALYPRGIDLNIWDQSPIGIVKEIVVSVCPNDFRVIGGNRIVGTGGMKRGVYFYNAATGHTTPGTADIVVQDNQYFYVNFRQYWVPRTASVSAQFSASGR